MLKSKQKNKYTVYYYLKRKGQSMNKTSTMRLGDPILHQPISSFNSEEYKQNKSDWRKKKKLKNISKSKNRKKDKSADKS